MKGAFQQAELDAMKEEAARLVYDLYDIEVEALSDVRRYWVSKGIEGMACVIQAHLEKAS